MSEDWRHRLTEGYHNLALSVQTLSSEGDGREKRLEKVEKALTGNGTSIQSRLAVAESRLAAIEGKVQEHTKADTSLAVAREGSRSTVVAAWIGGVVTLLVALAGLILTIAKG